MDKALLEKALAIVREKDKQSGTSWSEDSVEIAKLMVQFRTEAVAEIKGILLGSTPNRGRYKQWENEILYFDISDIPVDPYLQTR